LGLGVGDGPSLSEGLASSEVLGLWVSVAALWVGWG
jgi:hypothetical protein